MSSTIQGKRSPIDQWSPSPILQSHASSLRHFQWSLEGIVGTPDLAFYDTKNNNSARRTSSQLLKRIYSTTMMLRMYNVPRSWLGCRGLVRRKEQKLQPFPDPGFRISASWGNVPFEPSVSPPPSDFQDDALHMAHTSAILS